MSSCGMARRLNVTAAWIDKMEVVEGKTVKNITDNLQLPPASVAEL
jgi:hypothetical protein